MHIPACPTTEIEVLSFEKALTQRDERRLYNDEKWLYVPDFYSEYRYILGTKGEKPLICIGINPSTAEPDNLDNTLKSVERIAFGNGFDSFIMFNVYAQRATSPKDMEKECNEALHRENMKAFAYVLGLSENPTVWAAWGTIIKQRSYLPSCVLDMIEIGKRYDARWVTAGARSTAGGHPHHPLYLRRDTVIEDFDVESYCRYILEDNKKKAK